MNRVKDYYETIVKFKSLNSMAQYIISTSFCIIKYEEFVLNDYDISDTVFERVIEKKLFKEFRSVVYNYKEFPANGSN
jgi:hypothetical protein